MRDGLIGEAASRRTFHTLDGLRGIAAIAVVFYHFGDYVRPIRIGSPYLAVDLFFALSGFVLALAYRRRLEGGMGVGRFMLVRLVRLYPIYLVGLLIGIAPAIGALLVGGARNWTWGTVGLAGGAGLFFLPAPPFPGRPPALYPLNAPAWTLFFELVANLVFAVVLRRGYGRAVPAIALLSAPVVAAAILVSGTVDGGWLWPEFWLGVARVLFSFFLGVLACRALERGSLPAIRCPAWSLPVLLAVLLWFAPPAAWRAAYDLACVFVAMPALLWLAICNEPRRAARPLALLGLVSYPLYAIHVPVETLVLTAADRLLHGRVTAFAPLSGLVAVAALFVAAWGLAVRVDPAARRWLGSRLGLSVSRVP